MTHEEVDGRRVGQRPPVTSFLKVVYNSCPPVPRYSSTWDVELVLAYLLGLPNSDELPFQTLTYSLTK